MRNLSLLLLDDTRLTGRLPPEIGCLPLVVLHVSRNNISGQIPSEIGEILCLERMDLSSNNLSDELPMSLFKLTQLVMFNVSYNPFLSGNISINGQFGTFDEQSFLGDPLISFPQGGPAGKQRPSPEASDATVIERSNIAIAIIISYFFFLIVGFIVGTVNGGQKIG
uniref:Putative LRR receptor-like serine/threonine-protein kinase n=1 Tax=Aegilops tauschii TaxID=37682 RepID=R7WE49_AEGTA